MIKFISQNQRAFEGQASPGQEFFECFVIRLNWSLLPRYFFKPFNKNLKESI